MNLEEYVNEYLDREIKIVERFDDVYPFLSVYEKAIIYKYTVDGYEGLNEQLRISDGLNISEFGIHLKNTLEKIPPISKIAFRGVDLNKSQIDYYLNAYQNTELIEDPTFISASLGERTAWRFGKTRFRIFSKNWKDVSLLTKYIDEREVILSYNVKFKVLDYYFENNIHNFTIIEV
jgi:hypothetical protein